VSCVIVIPARGGSKGIARKNLQVVSGTPLVESAIRRALEAGADRVVVSTEDPEIRALSLSAGAEVPFERPLDLATDSVSIIHVLRHAIAELTRLGESVDVMCSLQPTAPFLRSDTLRRCLAKFRETNSDAVVTVRRVMHNHPYRTYTCSDAGEMSLLMPQGETALQRQDLPAVFALSGGFYVRRAALITQWQERDFALGRRCIGVEVSEIEGLNIDTPLDLAVSRCLAEGMVADAEERHG
jgi:N-acylneuraminate cytidylyltransferase